MYVGQQDELANTPFKQVKCNLVDAQWMGRFHLFIYGMVCFKGQAWIINS
jgi:hypothetical protein